MSDKYTFLTQAPVHRVIGVMAIPTIISMLLTSMYNLVDTFFVGKINTQSTAAVGIVFSVMFFILLLSAKVLTSLYELGLTLLTRYQPFLLPLFLLLN